MVPRLGGVVKQRADAETLKAESSESSRVQESFMQNIL